MVCPVVMYGCKSWTVKKAEHRRIDAFELWCWRRLNIINIYQILKSSFRKNYDQPRQNIKKRDITLPIKFHLVKAMVFPVVMYGCESCTVKKLSAEQLMLLNCCVEEDS